MISVSEMEPAAKEETKVDLNRRPWRDSINISAEVVTSATAGLPEAQQYLVRWIYSYAREKGWGWKEVGRQTTLSTQTLHKIWHGQYKDAEGNPVKLDGVCEKLARCKKLVTEREGLDGEFVDTSVFRMVHKVCEEARTMQMVSFIFSDGQIGKTVSCERVAELHNHGQTIYFRTPAAGGPQHFMRGLAERCGVSRKTKFVDLKNAIFEFFDHTKLLIWDEAHLIWETYRDRSAIACVELLRELRDLRECGLVVVSTNVFRDEMDSGTYKKMLAQLRRRGIRELQLPNVAPWEDVEKIAASYGLPVPMSKEAKDVAFVLVGKDGFGRFCKFLSKSAQKAAERKEKLTWDHFVRAHALSERMKGAAV